MAPHRPSVPAVSSVALRLLTTVFVLTVLFAGPFLPTAVAHEAQSEPDADAERAVANVPFEVAPWEVTTSTSAYRLPWLSEEDFEFRSDRSNWWNHRYRAGSGALGLEATIRRYMPVTEGDDEPFPYFHEAEAIVSTVALRAGGIVWPGIEVALLGGAGQLQLRSEGAESYDRYELGYHFGAEISGALSLRRLGLLGVELAYWTQEFRTEEQNNEAVVFNLGNEVVYRTYHFRAAAHVYLEFFGDPEGASLGLRLGGGYEYLYGHFQTLTRENFRLSGHQDLFALAGLNLTVGPSFALELTATAARRDGLGARLRLSHYFH